MSRRIDRSCVRRMWRRNPSRRPDAIRHGASRSRRRPRPVLLGSFAGPPRGHRRSPHGRCHRSPARLSTMIRGPTSSRTPRLAARGSPAGRSNGTARSVPPSEIAFAGSAPPLCRPEPEGHAADMTRLGARMPVWSEHRSIRDRRSASGAMRPSICRGESGWPRSGQVTEDGRPPAPAGVVPNLGCRVVVSDAIIGRSIRTPGPAITTRRRENASLDSDDLPRPDARSTGRFRS